MANVHISIGSDNLDAQFGGRAFATKRNRFDLGELCSDYGVRWCRFATLTVRPGSKRIIAARWNKLDE